MFIIYKEYKIDVSRTISFYTFGERGFTSMRATRSHFPFLRERNCENKPGRIRSARLGVKLTCMWRLSALGRCGHVNLSADTCRRSTRRNIRVPCLQRARNPTQSNIILPRAPRPNIRRSTRSFKWWCRGISIMAAG